MRDTTLSQDQDAPLRSAPSAPSIITAAVCAVHRAARDDAGEVDLLRALGLAPVPVVPPRRTPKHVFEARRTASERDKAEARGRANPELIPHGTTSGYHYWRCRCPICVAEEAGRALVKRENAKKRAPRVPLTDDPKRDIR